MSRQLALKTICSSLLMMYLSACSQQTVVDTENTDDVFASSTVKKQSKPKPSLKKSNTKKRSTPVRHASQQVNSRQQVPSISAAELRLIADKIFQNEGGGNPDNLVHWNEGEDFASLGVGHFTWYPAGRAARFGNTFPGLLTHLEANGADLPQWLQQARYRGAPWQTKTQLMQAKYTPEVQELKNFLYQTRLLQAAYIVERARQAMPKLVNAASAPARQRVAQNLNAVANTPGGWYVLVDYINFKGEGLNQQGGYNGQNWGLLQVLESMQPCEPGAPALHEFANAAQAVLERRVRNSPPDRNEARWLAGWSNRINTYRRPPV
jgi:hypothetical protein